MKTALICYEQKVTKKYIEAIKKSYRYNRIFVICETTTLDEKALEKEKKVELFFTISGKFLSSIKEIVKKYEKEYLLLPYFKGDNRSKYSIAVYNESFGKKIKGNIFKDKKVMNSFLSDIISKRNIKLGFQELQEDGYQEISEQIGKSFIVKPLNASNSVMSIRVDSEEEFLALKPKLNKKYRYILEEYMLGDLYSIDFFFDGETPLLLCYAREICLAEILDKLPSAKKPSGQDIYTPEFLHFITMSYPIDLSKLNSIELNFIKTLGKKLKDIQYRGFIHLEYKYDKKNKKIGFIEWGARPGGYRHFFVEEMHNIYLENIPFFIFGEQDYGKFKKKGDLYFLRGRDTEHNFARMRTCPLQKTHIMKILKKNPKGYLEVSFQKFLKDMLWDEWKIKVKKISFTVKTSSDYYLYPFYQRSDTRFDYMIEMDEENFQKFLKKKYKMIEPLILHDYKKS